MSQQQSKKAGQWQVWLMVGILSGVIIAGFLLFPHSEESRERLLKKLGTTNHGEFVLPAVSIKTLQLNDAEGQAWLFDDQKVKWRMLIPGHAHCNQACQDLLYLTRQVHISLGKYSRRFERLYLNLDSHLDSDTSEYMKQHPFLHTLYADEEPLKALLAGTNAPLLGNADSGNPLRAYLVDQDGLIMMSYTLANSGNEIIEDIEHLMKYSPDH
ncbi:SCO family protein [Porticoccus sp.]